ncbi:MAG: hypothetical protein U0V49_09605 [Saprospiraceae bacterium]
MEVFNTSLDHVTIQWTDNLQEIDSQWSISDDQPVLISLPYLRGLAETKPEGMELHYGLILKSNKIIGLVLCQVIGFDAERRLKIQIETGQAATLSDKIALAIKLFVARKVKVYAAIIGNLMTAGPYGFYFLPEISETERSRIMVELCKVVLDHNTIFKKSQVVVIKDLPSSSRIPGSNCKLYSRLNEFTIQPSMCMRIEPAWDNMDRYLNDLESKYRLKIRNALAKSEDLQVVDADVDAISLYNSEIYALYREVAESAGFNLVDLHPEYLLGIKRKVGNSFAVKLIFGKGQLIGFYSYFYDNGYMNAHFVGYRKNLNKQYHLYHNILLYYLKDALALKCKNIEFARTALEMKSSLGASPVDYYCYLSHGSRFVNHLVPKILEMLKPVEVWQPRSPFKAKTV